MVITDELFGALLRCETKAYLLSGVDDATPTPHAVSEWQQQINEKFIQQCRDLLTAKASASHFTGTPDIRDLRRAQYLFVIGPTVRFADLESRMHALEMASTHTPKHANHYIPIRFIPSEKITRYHRLQLAFDALILGKASGKLPISGKIIHGGRKRASSIKLTGMIREAESLVEKMRVLLTDSILPGLVLIAHCSECEFEARCRNKAVENDNLSLLGGMKSNEISKLQRRGIFTVTQLSYTFRPRKKSKRSNSKIVQYHQSLKALAIREKRIFVNGMPDLNVTGTAVYLDVEGMPDRDFYYLIGIRLVGTASSVQRSFWANDAAGEEIIWRKFLRLMAATDSPHLIHYGSYETTFLRQMKRRYGDTAQNGNLVDSLIDGARNILSTTYGRIYFPTYSNGLKEIASFLGFKWSTKSPSGQRSLLLRDNWDLTGDIAAKKELLAYNADDCQALELVVNNILKIIPYNGDPSTGNHDPRATDVESLQSGWPHTVGRVNFVFPELDQINRCAYWDYQRDRIYVRSNPRLRPVARRKNRKKSRSLPVNATVGPSRLRRCPRCDSGRVVLNGRHSRLLYDLRFSSGGVKRWTSKHVIDDYKCSNCGSPFSANDHKLSKHRYGLQLLAYVVYSLIELHIPAFKLSKIMHKLFGYPLSQSTISRLKRRAVGLYSDTFEEIKQNLLRGRLIHADETNMSTKGKASYVWVFTSMEEVVYVWSATREGNVAGDFLGEFKGVLVTDFYSAYDSIDCPQQKCLIHLIRDLNNDVLQEPFNEEIKEVVRDFTALLRPIIETIDRFGLKSYFLKRHKVNVTRFFTALLWREYKTELAQKAQERFRRNQKTLFTFLDYNNVPWNNNNAEHAINAFAGLREVIEGPSTENGIRDYLVLLSICQTCEYRGIDFLEFLRSGEKRIDDYVGKGRR